MQILNSSPIPAAPASLLFDDENSTRRRQFRWNREVFYQMDQLGVFGEKRVELIEGEILEMAPMGSPHITCVMILGRLLQEIFGGDFCVRTQGTLDLGLDSQPQPDVAVVRGTFGDYFDAHPTASVLVVEVSDSSLSIDRNVKSRIYARNSIPDYWIVNLRDKCVEVYREPSEDPHLGSLYAERSVFGINQSISPLERPDSKIMVADILR